MALVEFGGEGWNRNRFVPAPRKTVRSRSIPTAWAVCAEPRPGLGLCGDDRWRGCGRSAWRCGAACASPVTAGVGGAPG